MALKVREIVRDLVDIRGDLPRLATGGAWLFAIGSLFPLARLLSEGGAGTVFGTRVGGNDYTIPFLTYGGAAGMLLLCAELLAVAGAFILTAAPHVPVKLVRVSHGVLIAWSLVWTLGAWRLSAVDPGFWTLQALFLTVLTGCTLWRAWHNWTPRPGGSTSADKPSPAEATKSPSSYFVDPAPRLSAAPTVDATASTRQQVRDAMERARSAAIAGGKRAMVGIRAGIEAARNHNGGAKMS